MPAPERFQELIGFVEADVNTNLVMGRSHPEDEELGYEMYRLQIGADLARRFLEVARAHLNTRSESLLRDYDPGYKPDKHEIAVVTPEPAGRTRQILDRITELDAMALFEPNEELLRDLVFYSIVLSRGERSAAFVRTYSSSKELTMGGRFAAIFQQGTYDQVRDPAFLFDDHIDAVAFAEHVFVTRQGNFQRIFDFYEEARQVARQTVDHLVERVPIANFDEFSKAVTTQPQMVSKLNAIAAQPYLDDVTFDDIETVIEEFGVEVEVDEVNGVKSLIFDPSPQRRWNILKLLGDDYLGSSMTRLRYEVNSKSRLP